MKTNRHSHSSNKGPLRSYGTVGKVGLNHNFELLLTQIFCRRLNLEQGIVSLGVGLSYDLLRFIPCSTICFHPLLSTFCWGIILIVFLIFWPFYFCLCSFSYWVQYCRKKLETTYYSNIYEIYTALLGM